MAENNNSYQYFRPDWQKIRTALRNGDEAAVGKEYRRLKRQYANTQAMYDKIAKRNELEQVKKLTRKGPVVSPGSGNNRSR